MTWLIDDVAALLASACGWTIGTDLFTNDLPNAPSDATALYETGGAPPLETMGAASKPAVIQPRLQIQTRGHAGAGGHDAARSRARAAYDALVLVTNADVNGTYYMRLAPLQEPFFLRRDENERVYFAFNVEVHRGAE